MSEKGTLVFPQWMITSALEAPKEGYGIRVVDNIIVDVAPQHKLVDRYYEDEVWERPGQVLSPAFVDAHTHLYGILAHGIPLSKAPSGFMPFLTDFWWPLVEDQLDSSLVNAATDWNCAQILRSGVSAFYDCTEAPYSLPGVLIKQAQVVKKWGLRGILSFEATERVSKENGELGLQENLDMINWGKQDGGLVQGMMCYHTTFTCSDDFIRRAVNLAKENNVLTHMHCSEGHYEPEEMLKRNGLRTIEHYDAIGVLSPGMLLSQCVQISENEIRLLAERGARVTSMPLSNCEVGGGIAPLPQLTAAGLTVGLGSDGYITDFFEVMRGAFLIHKANHTDPRVMPANLVWHLATHGGAKAIGMENLGCIKPGWKADFILIKPNLPTPLRGHNIYDQLLLYCNAANVDTVVVDGIVKKTNGVVLNADMDALKANAQQAVGHLWEKAV